MIVVMALMLVAAQWAATRRLRRSVERSRSSGLTLLRHRWQIVLLFLCVIVGAGAVVARLRSPSAFSALPTLVFAVCVLCFSYLAVSPTVVVLGRSAVGTKRLVRQIWLAVFPLRTVHLLKAHPITEPVGFMTGLRDRDPLRWRRSVREVMRLSELVAIDARDVSPAVVAEAAASLGQDFVEKAVFVMESPDNSALLDAVLSEVQSELPHIRTASPDQLTRWLRGLAWKALTRRWGFFSRPMSAILIGSRRRWRPRSKPEETSQLCDEILVRLREGMAGADIVAHVDACPICRLSSRRYSPTGRSGVADTLVSDIPNSLSVGIDGPPLIEEILRRADKEGVEVVVLSSNSPAAQQPQWVLDALHVMAADPGLCLIVEDDSISPTPMDPCIVVRREHLLHGMEGFPPVTLRELAERLVRHATQNGRRFRRMPLLEVLPDLL